VWSRDPMCCPGEEPRGGRLRPPSKAVTRRGPWLRRSRLALVLALVVGVGLMTTATTGIAHASGSAPSTLTIDQANSPTTLDPGLQYDNDSYYVYRNIFDQLLHRNDTTLAVEPWIATSWKQTNPTTWVFQIRPGVKFSNGEALTGKDVAYSINRILAPSFASPQLSNFSAIASATGTATTTTIVTKSPSPTLLSYLTTLSIVPQAYVEKVGEKAFAVSPIGSGPYELSKWVQGSEVTLKANPTYWGAKPPYPTVEFRTVPSDAGRVADLESGAADIALNLTSDDQAQLQGNSSVKVVTNPTESVAYLALNVLGNTPTKNVKVRQAVADAIDYPALIKDLLGGDAKPVKEVLTPISFGYDASLSGFTYNPAKAKALLAASGDPHPSLTFPADPSYPTDVIQGIQADLEAVGMTVTIANTDAAAYLAKVQGPTHSWGSIRYGTWTCGCADADGTLEPLFHTGTIWSSYSNPAFDKDVDAARGTLNTAARKADYAKAFTVLQSDVAAIGLWQVYEISGVSKDIQWNPGPEESLFISQIAWKG
jgi:peptide/nickel transport system substrate-binding protein